MSNFKICDRCNKETPLNKTFVSPTEPKNRVCENCFNHQEEIRLRMFFGSVVR